MKKTLSVLLTLVLLLGTVAFALPVSATDDPPEYSGTCGENITWTLEDGVLTVSGAGAIEPLTRTGDSGEPEEYFPWNDAIIAGNYAKQGIRDNTDFYLKLLLGQIDLPKYFEDALKCVETLVIGEEITEIPSNAFNGNLLGNTIILPASLQTVGENALFTPLTTSLIIKNPSFDFAANPIKIWSLVGDDVPTTPQEAFDRQVAAFIAQLEYDRGEELAYHAYEMERAANMEATLAAIHNDPDMTPEEKEAALAAIEAETDYSDEYIANGIVGINQMFGWSAASYAEIKEISYALLNDFLGTSFTTYTEMYAFEDDGRTRVHTAALDAALAPLQARLDAAEGAINVYESYALGEAPADGASPVPWLTVYGYAGSAAQTAAETSGVNFAALCPVNADHTVTEKAEIAPTCTEIGHEAGWYCEDCGVYLSGGNRIDPTGHQHTTEVAASEPTRTAHGYTEGVFCSDCQTYLSGHEVIHNQLGARNVVKEATVDAEGEVEIVCTVCGGKGLYALEKLEPQPQQPDEPDGGGDEDGGFFKKLAQGIVNFFLRLIKWLGGNKK